MTPLHPDPPAIAADPSAMAAVRAATPMLAAEVAATLRSGRPERTGPADLDDTRATELAEQAVTAVLSALESAALPAPAPGTDLRQSVADALLRSEPAEQLAVRGRVRLAPVYGLLLLDGAASADESRADLRAVQTFLNLEHRRDLLATTAVQHRRLVVLVPLSVGAERAEVRALAERAARGLTEAGRDPVLAVSAATDRAAVPAALDEAKDIMNVVRKLDYPTGVYQLEDVPVETSLMRSPDLATLLALRLAPLSGSGAPLQETLRIYLESSQDRRHAARALHVHPNTLDYRLRRIRELTGLSPTVPRDIQTLGAAITASRLTGLERA